MKTQLSILFCIIVLSFGVGPVYGQTNITPKTIRISLTVEAPSSTLQNKVFAMVLAELKKTPDLEIVDDVYIYGLELVAYDIRTSTGVNLGIALSTVTTNVIPCNPIFDSKTGKVNAKYQVLRHALTLTDNRRLRADVQTIVADFNKRIDPMRKVKVTLLN